jgi:hypothetical protein
MVIVIYLLSSLAQTGSRAVEPRVQTLADDPVLPPAMSAELLEMDGGNSTLGLRYAIAHFAGTPGTWRSSALSAESLGYDEGGYVPFMLLIENAVPGSTYIFAIRYDCAQAGGDGYDFLSSYDRDHGVAAAQDRGGPGTAFADSALAIPDDPSIPFDDGEDDRTFDLWGGSFASSVVGPSPDGLCAPASGQKVDKTYTVALTAQEGTLYLLWSGHLATGEDSGVGS